MHLRRIDLMFQFDFLIKNQLYRNYESKLQFLPIFSIKSVVAPLNGKRLDESRFGRQYLLREAID